MSTKDYEIIAGVLRASRERAVMNSDRSLLTELADQFADALATDNPRFNRATFLRACGA